MLRGVGAVLRPHNIGLVRFDPKRHRFELGAGEGGAEGARSAAGGPPPEPVGGEVQPRREGSNLGRLWAALREGEEGLHARAFLAEAPRGPEAH